MRRITFSPCLTLSLLSAPTAAPARVSEAVIREMLGAQPAPAGDPATLHGTDSDVAANETAAAGHFPSLPRESTCARTGPSKKSSISP